MGQTASIETKVATDDFKDFYKDFTLYGLDKIQIAEKSTNGDVLQKWTEAKYLPEVTTVLIPNLKMELDRLPKTDAEFKERMAKDQVLKYLIDLDMTNLVIAGGSISNVLRNRETQTDADLFIVGGDKKKAMECVERVRLHLVSKWTSKNTRIYLTPNCVTFYHKVDKTCIQVVLSLFDTAAKVIEDFDLGSCSALWDGSRVWVNRLGKSSTCKINVSHMKSELKNISIVDLVLSFRK